MASTAIIAATAASSSAAASAAARNARITECKVSMPGFKHEGATVAEIRHYSGCADLMLPMQPLSGGAAVALKLAIIICLLSAPIAAWKFGDSLLERAAILIFAPFVTACGLFLAAVLAIGVAYLFS